MYTTPVLILPEKEEQSKEENKESKQTSNVPYFDGSMFNLIFNEK